MLSLFKSNNPGVVVLYLLYLVGFRVCFLFVPVNVNFVFTDLSPLSAPLFGWLKQTANPTAWLVVLGGVLTFIQALLVNGIVNENKMTPRKTYLPGLVFVLFSSFFMPTMLLSPASVSLLFIILATASVFRLSKKEKAYGDVFDVGFLSAIAALVYFPTVVFILFAYIGMGTVRSFIYREWTAVLLGFLTPLFLAFTVYYTTETTPGNFLPVAWPTLAALTPLEWITLGVFVAISLAFFVLLPGVLYSSLIQVRKFTTLLTFMFFLWLGAALLQQHFGASHVALVAFPAAVVASMVIVQLKHPVIPEVIHLILTLLALAGPYLPLFNLI